MTKIIFRRFKKKALNPDSISYVEDSYFYYDLLYHL